MELLKIWKENISFKSNFVTEFSSKPELHDLEGLEL